MSLPHDFFPTSIPQPSMRSRCHDYLTLTRFRDNRIRKAGPNFLMFTSGGNSASVVVPKTFAKIKSSPSGTRRCRVSNFASDSRLTSQPKTCNFADKSSCVQPLRSRNSRTCGPIRLSGNEPFLMSATVAVSDGKTVRLRSQIRLVKWKVFPQSSDRNADGGHMEIIGNAKRLGFLDHSAEARFCLATFPPPTFTGLPFAAAKLNNATLEKIL